MTRRRSDLTDNTLKAGNITLDRSSCELKGPDGSFRLASKEYQMLEMLMANPGMLINTERFMEKIWGYDTDVEINVVWVYVSYLRKKLNAVGADVMIKAARNMGYSLEGVKEK